MHHTAQKWLCNNICLFTSQYIMCAFLKMFDLWRFYNGIKNMKKENMTIEHFGSKKERNDV